MMRVKQTMIATFISDRYIEIHNHNLKSVFVYTFCSVAVPSADKTLLQVTHRSQFKSPISHTIISSVDSTIAEVIPLTVSDRTSVFNDFLR